MIYYITMQSILLKFQISALFNPNKNAQLRGGENHNLTHTLKSQRN